MRPLVFATRNPGKLVSRRQLLTEVWGPSYGTESNYLRVYMAQLRRKLEPVPSRPRHLLTDVMSEELTHAVALAQPRQHAVEPGLQQADLAAVVDGHGDVGVPALDPPPGPPLVLANCSLLI